MKKLKVFIAVFVVAMLLLTACQTATTPTTEAVEPTQAEAPTTPPETTAPTQPPAETAAPTEAPPAETPPPSGPGDTPLNLIMVQHALCAWDAFWCTVEEGIQAAAEQMGVEVTVLGPDKFDLERTAALIDQAVAAQPDGIGLTVTDPVLFKEPITKALDAGIPVLAYNAGSGPVADQIPYMTYLGMDEYQGGYQSGLRLIEAGGTQGVCINHQVGHAGLDARCRGLLDAFEEKGLTAEVLGVRGEDAAQAQTTISDFYTANPDVDAFLTLGPSSANPFYAFVEASQPAEFAHITFDLTPEVEAKIKDATTLAAVDQQPFLQGYGAVMYLMMRQRFGITPASPITATGPGFITADTLGN